MADDQTQATPSSELGGLAEHAESLCQMLHPGKTHDQSTTDTLAALARRDAQEAAMTYTELDRAYDAATLDASRRDPNWNKPTEPASELRCDGIGPIHVPHDDCLGAPALRLARAISDPCDCEGAGVHEWSLSGGCPPLGLATDPKAADRG